MIPLPKWIKEFFDKSLCPYCKKSLKSEGVCGIGIREEKSENKSIHSFFYQYKCSNCSNWSVFTGFPTTYEDFIADIIEVAKLPMPTMDDIRELEKEMEGIEGTEGNPPNIHRKKSGMTDQEVRDFKKMIDDNEYFLAELGFNMDLEEEQDENK